MGILCAILSLPISILLVRWLIKKKMENPFEKGDVRRLIIAGMLSMVVAAVVTLLIIVIRAFRIIGVDTLKLYTGSCLGTVVDWAYCIHDHKNQQMG